MRIVHVLLTSRFAGTERYAIELAAAQAHAGHEVTMVVRRAAMQKRPDAIGHRCDPRVKLEVVGDFASAWRARRVVRALRPDIAHAHLSAACRAVRGLPAITARIATLHIRYKPHQHACMDGLIAIAPWQLDAMPPSVRARCTQIDNWTQPRDPSPGARERIRASLGLGADTFVVGALGRIERSKGLDILVEAFERLRLPDAALVIVGQGREWQRLRAHAGAAVQMPGFTDVPHDWLEAFDLFVSAARSEPFGLVLLEAMNAGLPIVASASEGASHLADIIDSPLVPVGDVDALGQALHREYAARRSRRAYPLARFRIAHALPRIEAFYRDCIARSGGRSTA